MQCAVQTSGVCARRKIGAPSFDQLGVSPPALYYRHTLPVRIMHWINVIALTLLFMSGLNIFDAHSALYWGQSSYSRRPWSKPMPGRKQSSVDSCWA